MQVSNDIFSIWTKILFNSRRRYIWHKFDSNLQSSVLRALYIYAPLQFAISTIHTVWNLNNSLVWIKLCVTHFVRVRLIIAVSPKKVDFKCDCVYDRKGWPQRPQQPALLAGKEFLHIVRCWKCKLPTACHWRACSLKNISHYSWNHVWNWMQSIWTLRRYLFNLL